MNDPWNQGATAQPVQPVNPYLNWTPAQVLSAHIEAKKALEKAKERELALRLETQARYFPGNVVKGTHNFELGNGYSLKLVNGENIKVADVEGQSLEDTLDEIAKIGNLGAVMADEIVKFKPSLAVVEYKKLVDNNDEQAKRIKALIDKHITVTPATPTLEFVEPKNK